MSINLKIPDVRELKPRITVFGTGGAGGNAVNNMITSGLQGVDFVVANTDAQALTMSKAERIIQMGVAVTEGLGAGSQPEVGRAAAEEAIDEIRDHLQGARENVELGRQVCEVLPVGIDREVLVRTHLDLGAPQHRDLLVVDLRALEHLRQAPEEAKLADLRGEHDVQ